MWKTPDGVVFLKAASANPLPKEEVIARLGEALRRNLSSLPYRQRRGVHTPSLAALKLEVGPSPARSTPSRKRATSEQRATALLPQAARLFLGGL